MAASLRWRGRVLAMRVIRPFRIIARRARSKAFFRSNEDFYETVRGLVARLERGGHPHAAAELEKGFGCLKGLTDGLFLFLESIERVEANDAERFADDDRNTLELIHMAVYWAASPQSR